MSLADFLPEIEEIQSHGYVVVEHIESELQIGVIIVKEGEEPFRMIFMEQTPQGIRDIRTTPWSKGLRH